jgi:hypothetical protein
MVRRLAPAALVAALLFLAVVPAARAARPVVWVQAGHEAPREPGYRAQTGASDEVAFNRRVAAALERRLRSSGVDARHTPGRVTPIGARGAVFVSIHHDTPQGAAAVGHAVTGAGENWYRGEGFGVGRSFPYPDSAAHRTPAARVSAVVEARSRRLARLIQRRYAAVFTRANGARSGPVRLVPRDGSRRMTRFYGFYRTAADARVIVEAGAAGTDAAMLRRTDLIAASIAGAILAHLHAEGRLPD